MNMINISKRIMKRWWRYGINAYIVPTEPMPKFFALLKVFFSLCMHLFFATDKCTMAIATDKSEICFHI